jgi:hypothetical protein
VGCEQAGGVFGEGGRQTFTNQDVFSKSSLDEISPRGGVERQNILKPLLLQSGGDQPHLALELSILNAGSLYYLSSRPPKPRRVLTD